MKLQLGLILDWMVWKNQENEDMAKDKQKKFITLVDRSALRQPEKDELKRQVEESGVTPEMWHRFDELLVVAFEDRQKALNEYRLLLDNEVVKYTSVYERKKKVIDQKMRTALARLNDNDRSEHDRLWNEYHERIRKLQEKLLVDMKETSRTTLLKSVSVIP